MVMVRLLVALLGITAYVAVAKIEIVERPMMLYNTVSPKLRIQATAPVFGNIPADHIELKFTPSLKPSAYNLSVVSDTVISLSLRAGKKWGTPHTTDGMTLYLDAIFMNGGENQLDDEKEVATIIPTPKINPAADLVIYQKGTSKLVINGSNFRPKNMELMFDPPLVRDKDYILSVKSATSMVLTRTTGTEWRDEPGPLKVRRINTGAGALRVDPSYGGIVVAEVQADLGAHGVTVESTPEEKFYQSQGSLIILGTGFNATKNTLRFANGLRGKGVNYTTVEHSGTQLKLELAKKSKWRANPTNLPGPLVLLAVDAGAGFVPVGPTEAKKGRTVATIFEDPSVVKNTKTAYKTHTHQIWVVGAGFTKPPAYQTVLTLDPPLTVGEDYSLVVYNRTHMLLSLFEGKSWKGTEGKLKITHMDTGAGTFAVKNGVQIATIKSDDEDHPSGVTVTRTTQTLYQTAAIRKLVIQGSGFTDDTDLTFDPPLEKNKDYTQRFVDANKLVLSLKKRKKWRWEGGALMVKTVDVGLKSGEIKVGSGGLGIQVANILFDPTIEESERIIFSSHTRRLVIRGTGFSLEGTELTLRPTKRKAYEIESLEMTEIVLLLNDGQSWADVKDGESEHIYVTKVDTGAGEVIMDDDGVIVAKVESDNDDNNCDDSCEWALDGVCDDGSGKGRYWYDDDFGGFYAYDDDYYGYGYYYYGDDDFLAPVCDPGSDCTDCGGPQTSDVPPTECDNTCQWANDGFCDDTRTSGLCDEGTDCHDCGPVGASNFSTWDDDGWWDDDDNYWDIDDTFDYGGEGGKKDTDESGAGGVFMSLLEGMVYVVGAVVFGGGTYVAVKFYKGQTVPFVPNIQDGSTEDLIDQSTGRANVPITPDVTYT